MPNALQEADVYAALGMDVPANQSEVADQTGQTGAKEPELTEPAGAQTKEAGSPGTDPADGGTAQAPAGEEAADFAQEDGDGASPSDADGSGDSAQTRQMSKAERARQAQLRRDREKQAAVDAAVAAEREKLNRQHAAELEEIFSRAGMTDKYNENKPIKTMEDFRAWDSKAKAAGLSRRLQEGKLTPEDLQAAVEASPAMQAVKAQAAQLEAQAQEQAKARYQQMVDRELAEIRELDPSVTSLKDILDRENGAEFARLVQENKLSFVQAFRLTNGDRVAKAQALAAAEGAARQQHGKDHMRSAVSGGAVIQDVPRQVVALYRQMEPGMSMDEIRKDYAKRMGVK